jgi:protein-S-isoprenylcysteine O-methyltransferase Ste14
LNRYFSTNMPSSIFTSDYAALGFVIALVCFFVAEQIGGVIVPAMRRGGAKVQRRNVGSSFLVIFSWVAVLGFTVVFAKMGYGLLPDWIYFIGIAVMLAGIVFRQWAIAVLGRYFSREIGVQKEHKVVETGPYRLIRHPSYTGVLIFYVGMGLAVQSFASILVAAAIFGIAYGYRIFVEEKVLISELGNNYAEYMKRTKRIIPYIM